MVATPDQPDQVLLLYLQPTETSAGRYDRLVILGQGIFGQGAFGANSSPFVVRTLALQPASTSDDRRGLRCAGVVWDVAAHRSLTEARLPELLVALRKGGYVVDPGLTEALRSVERAAPPQRDGRSLALALVLAAR